MATIARCGLRTAGMSPSSSAASSRRYPSPADRRKVILSTNIAETSLRNLTEIPLLIRGLRDDSKMVRENSTYIRWLMTTKEFRDDADAWERWWKEEGSKGGGEQAGEDE